MVDKLVKTPLCEHTSCENSSKFLKSNDVFDKCENFSCEGWPQLLVKPSHLDGSLRSFSMLASFAVPTACLNASEELDRYSAIYDYTLPTMFSSIMPSLAPEDERAPVLNERITSAAEALMRAITASVVITPNILLVCHDVVLDHLLLNQPMVTHVRMAPFVGAHLMGPEPKELHRNYEVAWTTGSAWWLVC